MLILSARLSSGLQIRFTTKKEKEGKIWIKVSRFWTSSILAYKEQKVAAAFLIKCNTSKKSSWWRAIHIVIS